jgi:hypothetical protein
MAHDAPGQVVERARQRWPWANWLGPFTIGVTGVVALFVVVSAITVVSKEPFGPMGVVLPTRPLTTTSAPPPVSEAPIPPPVTRAPTVAPPAIAPTTAPPNPQPPPPPPPPKPSATRAPSTRSEPSSAHPTTHRPFPQETTDFLGPPGTNH